MSKTRQSIVSLLVAPAVALSFGLTLVAAAPAHAEESAVPQLKPRASGQSVTADPLPTVQLDGDKAVVWSQDIAGDTVYAGGSFSNVKPAGAASGTNLTPRSNLVAYSISTGNLVTSWAPSVNGTVRAIEVSPDGSRVYVGGSFTVANGSSRYLFAAFDAKTGNLVSGFSPSVGGAAVYAIQATASTVYVGGLFTQANGVTRKNLAAFNASNGALLAWAPTTDLQVDTMVLDPAGSTLIAGGRFGKANDVTARGLASLSVADGSLQPWVTGDIVKNGVAQGAANEGKAGISTLTSDGNAVYGTGWVYSDASVGNLEGAFSATPGTGQLNWIADCHGDHYGIWSDGSTVYTTDHAHSCETTGGQRNGATNQDNMRHAGAFTASAQGTLPRPETVSSIYKDWSGYPGPARQYWSPEWLVGTVMGQAGWSITGNNDYIAVGGEFIGVNNAAHRGLVRFAKTPAAGAKQAPRLSDPDWKATASTSVPGTAIVSVPTNYDRDDVDLKYRFFRTGSSTPFAVVDRQSPHWQRSVARATDTGLTAGTSYSYYVEAVDGDGNKATSSTVTVTATSGTAPTRYAASVANDGPDFFWRLGSGTTVSDLMGNLSGAASSISNTPGAIAGDSSNASTFTGSTTSGSRAYASASRAYPTEVSLESWVKTNTTRGGSIISFGNSQTGNSTTYDHTVYMSNDGKLNYALYYSGQWYTVKTPSSYNDNAWHHVVVTQSLTGSRIYVDGVLQAYEGAMRYGRKYTSGYWRVGGDAISSGVGNKPTNNYFTGALDEVATYPFALTGTQVAAHRDSGLNMAPPEAAFAASIKDLTAGFDASGSSASDGRTIAGYAWDFGDGSTGSGAAPSHDYTKAGTYDVTLTVTDSGGSTGTQTKQVTVTAPHLAPSAAIDHSGDGLTARFDGTGSTADNGSSIESYAWTFGDGSTSTAAKPQHVYAAAGRYDVTLTVTDNTGVASQPATTVVEVTHADPTPAFTASTSQLKLGVDASQSAAADGATLSYDWDFGDGKSGTGVTASHTYAASGTYTVTLQVTDSLGARASTTRKVAVAEVPVAAADAFDRSVPSGWGQADAGGAWTTPLGAGGVTVADGVGKVQLTAGATRQLILPATAEDTASSFSVTLDKVPAGTTAQFNYIVRRSSAGDYRLKLRYAASGQVNVWLTRYSSSTGAETLISGDVRLPGVTYAAGDTLKVYLESAVDDGASALRAKVWAATASEPSAWTVTAKDSTAGLQTTGAIGFQFYAPAALTNAPLTMAVDNLVVTALGAPAAVPPTANMTQSIDGRTVSFDGSGSTAASGASVNGYAWDFGDGTTSTEAKPKRLYAQDGTYTVKLVVTDSRGASSSPVTRAVTVAHAIPVASFSSVVETRALKVDGSASSASDGATLTYAWDFGDGTTGSGRTDSHSYAAPGTYVVTLTVTDSLGATATASQSVTASEDAAIASDGFSRSTTTGWGNADVGGAWSGTTGLSVADGVGKATTPAGQSRTATLPAAVGNSTSTFTLSTDKVATGGGLYFSNFARQTAAGDYRVKLWLSNTGTVSASLVRTVGGTETALASRNVSGYTHVAGGALRVKFQTVSADGVTTLKARVWPLGQAEPSAWLVESTDATASLQGAGKSGFFAYASGSLTNGPVVYAVDDLSVR